MKASSHSSLRICCPAEIVCFSCSAWMCLRQELCSCEDCHGRKCDRHVHPKNDLWFYILWKLTCRCRCALACSDTCSQPFGNVAATALHDSSMLFLTCLHKHCFNRLTVLLSKTHLRLKYDSTGRYKIPGSPYSQPQSSNCAHKFNSTLCVTKMRCPRLVQVDAARTLPT